MNRYTQGTYFERLVQHWLERNGYYVMRSAASHTAFDLGCFPLDKAKQVGLETDIAFVIQCKSLDFTKYSTTMIDSYLWGKELTSFRLTIFSNTAKYLFIFNSKNKKDEPYIFLFENGNYQRVDTPTLASASPMPDAEA